MYPQKKGSQIGYIDKNVEMLWYNKPLKSAPRAGSMKVIITKKCCPTQGTALFCLCGPCRSVS